MVVAVNLADIMRVHISYWKTYVHCHWTREAGHMTMLIFFLLDLFSVSISSVVLDSEL